MNSIRALLGKRNGEYRMAQPQATPFIISLLLTLDNSRKFSEIKCPSD